MKPILPLLLSALITVAYFQSTAQTPVTSGGAGAPAGSGVNGANNKGLPATGLGCGGGGGSWWGGTGGPGKFGGGGGGAGGYFSLGAINWAGGDGGQGVVVIALYNGAIMVSAQVKTDGSSFTIPAGVTSAKVWAIGAGGGGGGATANDGTSGGSGAAGGVAYITKTISPGDIISYSIGAGGLAGHGAINGTAGGNTSVTIAGTTIYGNGGGAGQYNNTSNATGGTYSGGDGGANGGTGYGRSGDVGGGGGGAIGTVNGTQAGNDGGTGANPADVSGLFAACAIAVNPTLPTLTSFTPTAGLTGTSVIITGTGFTGASAVRIGGITATSFTINSDTEISAVVSGTTVTGSVSVTLPFVSLSLPIYFFTAPVAPSITSFSPTSAQTGELVTITGNKFLGTTSVNFGGTAASSFTVNSDFQIVATVGSGTSGDVVISSSSGSGSRSGFTWTAITQASSISFTNIQSNQITINWTNGNAQKRIVFVKEGAGAFSNPANNTTYTASANWSVKGSTIGSSGYYCVYNSTGNSVTITNLAANTQYTVQALEYNGVAGAEVYYTATALNNPNSQSTLGVLPLTWLDISVKEKQNQALLEWTTIHEVNIVGFTVQHSTDGIQWTSIGLVNAVQNGNSEHRYRFTHTAPQKGNNYYRIEEINEDGKNAFSKVLFIQINNPLIRLLHQPVTNGQISFALNESATVQLFSAQGQLLFNRYLSAGSHTLESTHLSKGIYFLRTDQHQLKIIIQ